MKGFKHELAPNYDVFRLNPLMLNRPTFVTSRWLMVMWERLQAAIKNPNCGEIAAESRSHHNLSAALKLTVVSVQSKMQLLRQGWAEYITNRTLLVR